MLEAESACDLLFLDVYVPSKNTDKWKLGACLLYVGFGVLIILMLVVNILKPESARETLKFLFKEQFSDQNPLSFRQSKRPGELISSSFL